MELTISKKELENLIREIEENQNGGLSVLKKGDKEISVWGTKDMRYSQWFRDYILSDRIKKDGTDRYYLAAPSVKLSEYVKENMSKAVLLIDADMLEITDISVLNKNGQRLAGINNGQLGHLLKTDYIYRYWSVEDIFGDEVMFCPVCGKSKFTILEPAGSIWCEECNANFTVRHTAGDPGVVVDAHINPKQVSGYLLPEGKLSFWMILKDCNEGLNDRTSWCAYIGANHDDNLTRDKAVGRKQFYCECCHKTYTEDQMDTINWDDHYVVHRGICKNCKEKDVTKAS